MASRDQETQPSSSALSREEIREAAKAARACKVLAPGSLRLLHSDIDDDISDRLPEPFRPEYAIALASLKAHHYAEAQSVLWDLQEKAAYEVDQRVAHQKVLAQQARESAAYSLAYMEPEARATALSSFIAQQVTQMQAAIELIKTQAKNNMEREHQASLKSLQQKYADYTWWLNLSFMKQTGVLDMPTAPSFNPQPSAHSASRPPSAFSSDDSARPLGPPPGFPPHDAQAPVRPTEPSRVLRTLSENVAPPALRENTDFILNKAAPRQQASASKQIPLSDKLRSLNTIEPFTSHGKPPLGVSGVVPPSAPAPSRQPSPTLLCDTLLSAPIHDPWRQPSKPSAAPDLAPLAQALEEAGIIPPAPRANGDYNASNPGDAAANMDIAFQLIQSLGLSLDNSGGRF